jgi:ABC-type transporter Mla subunit MlaD
MNQIVEIIKTNPYLTNREFPLQDLQEQTLNQTKELNQTLTATNVRLDSIIDVIGNIEALVGQTNDLLGQVNNSLTALNSTTTDSSATLLEIVNDTDRLTAALRDEFGANAKLAIGNTAATPIFTAPVG